jgi:dihydrofolate reductase
MTKRRNVIVHIETSADGYIARRDGDLEWLTSRPKPEGFYGMGAFMKSIDTKLLGRKTYEWSRRIREPPAGAAGQGYLVDGRRRSHCLIS